MSIRLIQLVWNTELTLTPSEKLVLFCLANFANDNSDLLCYPSYSTLEKKTGLHKTSLIRIIDRLCKENILIKNKIKNEENSHSSNNYLFNENVLSGIGGGSSTMLPGWSHHATTPSSTMLPNKYISDNSIDNKKNILKKRNSENEKYTQQAKELIDMFIRLTGKKYRYSPTLMQPIVARLKEGYTFQECKVVIARKYHDWKDSKEMKMYIRPVTIFRASKFPEYLAECVTEEEKEKLKYEYSTKLDNR